VSRVLTTCRSFRPDVNPATLSSYVHGKVNLSIQIWMVPFALLQSQACQLPCLSSAERYRATRKLTAQSARNYSLRRSFLRSVLASQMKCLPVDINIRYLGNGKPFVPDGPAFNLSHCEQLIVVAVANNDFTGQIGVDVQPRISDPDILSLADKCFTKVERNQLATYRSQVSRLNAFTRGWTRKEAIVKASGSGLRTPLDSFTVSLESKTGCESNGLQTAPSPLPISKSNPVSLGYCDLYDLGNRLSCEVSLAVLHHVTVPQTTVRVFDVDEYSLNTMGMVACG